MVTSRPRATPLVLACLLLLGACGFGAAEEPEEAELDPAVARALEAPLMTDPDLAGLNEANAALTGSRDHSLPTLVATQEAVRDAQDQAIRLAGGRSGLAELPPAKPIEAITEESPLVLLEDVAARMQLPQTCLAGVRYSTGWAARLPARLPVYPRGAVVEAFGRDGTGCAMRAVRFASPVPAQEILRFYATLAARDGFTVTYGESTGLWRIEARKADARLLVEVRPSLLEGQEIDLVSAAGTAVSRR